MKVARVVKENKQVFIPNPKLIQKYRTLREVFAVKDDLKVIESDFVEAHPQASSDIETLERSLNDLWEKMIKEFEGEFYTEERSKLRDMYKISFSSESSDQPVQIEGTKSEDSTDDTSGVTRTTGTMPGQNTKPRDDSDTIVNSGCQSRILYRNL